MTNTVATKSPTISYTDSSGHTTTASNTSTTTATQNQDKNSPIDLTNIQNALNQMNKTLTETKTMIKDLIEYKPSNLTQFDTSLQNFKNGFTDFSLKIDGFLDFLNSFPDFFDDLNRQLEDLLALFDNKPELSLPSGQCPFQANWYGQTFQVDPCKFVAPYRPIMVIFLTFFMSFAVLLFALKYLFNVSFGGK